MYLGNSPTQQAFTPAVDVFSGNGSTTAFTLSRPVASVAQVQAFIENVPQSPVDAFTVNGNTITFTSAPPSGSSNIYVRYTSPITQVIMPSFGTVGQNQLTQGAPYWDVNGNVGIGTSSPSAKLHVAGNVTVNDGQQYCFGSNNYNGMSGSAASNIVQFYTNNAERARIDSSGNLLVGGVDMGAETTILHPPSRGQTTTYVRSVSFQVAQSAGSAYPGQYRWYTSTTNGSAYRFGYNLQLRSYDTGTNAETTVATAVNTAWYQGNNSSTWSTTSDQRIKTNIRPISDALAKICALKPCHFEMVNALGEVKTNFIAQEFEEVFSGHVSEMTTPEEFKDFTDSPTIKTIDPNLIPYLVAAIKEQQALITSLTSRIAALEAK